MWTQTRAGGRLVRRRPTPVPSSHTAKRPFECGGSATNRDVYFVPEYPSVLVSGDGATLLCSASGVFRQPGQLGNGCPAVPLWNYRGVLEYSTATGKQAGTLYRGESNCLPGPDPVWLLWTSDSGDAALGYLEYEGPGPDHWPDYRFGLFTAGTFTPLPAPPTINSDLEGTAW